MAKAKLPDTIDAIAGHTGSLNFWLGASGTYVSTTPRPPAPQTPAQKREQAAWTAMVKAWNQFVTTSEKQGWDAFGTTNPTKTRCGGTARVSGFTAFMRSNLAITHAGKPLRTSAPSSYTSPAPGALTLTWTAGPPESLELAAQDAPSANQVPIITGSGPKLPGVQDTTVKTKTLAILTEGQAGPYQIAASWTLDFGPIRSGQNLIVGLYYVDFTSGAVSTKQRTSLIVP